MIRQFIWVLAALLALGIVGLMIVTPTPDKPGQAPVVVVPADGTLSNGQQVPQTR
jgi:hypothetical protein